ncbi:membrane protein insertion efficiency factor YidD [Candidatus Microgenomates bacterium]|nr:membrane protein insertion efficiency factor YidD [Candidatus Microgenomates bacterium]
MKHIAIFIISFYQALFPFRGHCRFYPTCSSYAKKAIERYGVFRGLTMGIVRILRCNPFFGFGADLAGVKK